MIKLIILSTMINTGEVAALPPFGGPKIERSRKGKGRRDRRRGGNGLR